MAERYDPQDYVRDRGNGPQHWHTEKIARLCGFSSQEIAILICHVNQTFQGWFGGNPDANKPVQFANSRTPVRAGDPKGIVGFGFVIARQFYYGLEHIPLVNNLKLWMVFDLYILRHSEDELDQRYLKEVQRLNTVLFSKALGFLGER